MKRLLRNLSEIEDQKAASRRILNSNFREDLGLLLDSPRDTVAAIKEHEDKAQILRGLLYMLPLSLPLLRLLPADELSAERVKKGFTLVSEAMEDTLSDYSDLLNLPGTEQQEHLMALAKKVEQDLQHLQDGHLKMKKDLEAAQALLGKKEKQIADFKKLITELEQQLSKEQQSFDQACAEEKRLKARITKTGSELKGQKTKMVKKAKSLQSLQQDLQRNEADKKCAALLKKMDKLLAEVDELRPEDELSTLAAAPR